MGQLQKGPAQTVGFMATLCLIFGGGVAVVAWILKSRNATSVTVTSLNGGSDVSFSFSSYWWGGLGFAIPGILGIIAGFTRNSCVMAFYLVFNILSCIASIGMSVLVAMLVVSWGAVDDRLNNYFSGCISNPIFKQCICSDIEYTWTIDGANCEDILDLKTLLFVLIACSGIASLVSFIATYVSCSSMCNQEQEPSGIIIQQARQPTIVVNQQSNFNQAQPQQPNMGYAQQNMGYAQPPPYAQNLHLQQQQYVSSKDRARLMTNQVI